MTNPNPVVHFEMPYDDQQRMVDFYSKAFGWQAQVMGPEMGNYVVVTTTEMDPQTRFPTQPGRINGGLFKKDPKRPYPSIVIAVENIQDAIQRVKEAGGTDIGGSKPGEPDDIPGVGSYILFTDTEGNRIGMLQPAQM